jgi:cob(I)alamin adenosyltransferase
MKIYTKRGDLGQTDLFGGARVSKAHLQVRAYGAVDAANSALGFVVASKDLDVALKDPILTIMSDLFDLGAELATAPKESAKANLDKTLTKRVNVERIHALEQLIDKAQAELPELRNFILPTGSESSARLHLARVAVRLAEQESVALQDAERSLRPELIQYLNRLSDLLFVWARFCNHKAGVPDVLWQG